MLLNIWATFAKYLVPKNFQKSPNLVTLPSSQIKSSVWIKKWKGRLVCVSSIIIILFLFEEAKKPPKENSKKATKTENLPKF